MCGRDYGREKGRMARRYLQLDDPSVLDVVGHDLDWDGHLNVFFMSALPGMTSSCTRHRSGSGMGLGLGLGISIRGTQNIHRPQFYNKSNDLDNQIKFPPKHAHKPAAHFRESYRTMDNFVTEARKFMSSDEGKNMMDNFKQVRCFKTLNLLSRRFLPLNMLPPLVCSIIGKFSGRE